MPGKGAMERFNGRIEDVLQSHHFRSGEELNATMHRYVWLYNQQLPQSALGSKTPLQAMKDWNKLKPELFKKKTLTTSRDVTPMNNAKMWLVVSPGEGIPLFLSAVAVGFFAVHVAVLSNTS